MSRRGFSSRSKFPHPLPRERVIADRRPREGSFSQLENEPLGFFESFMRRFGQFFVLDSQHRESSRFQKSRSFKVAIVLHKVVVSFAIQLHDEIQLLAKEIKKVATERALPLELHSKEPSPP